MLTDDDLPPLRADQTCWHTLHGVHLRKSPKPVDLELRWVFSADYIAARRQLALTKLEGDELRDEETKLMARFLVVSWRHVPDGPDGPEMYTPEGGAKLLMHLRAQAPDLWTSIEIALGSPRNFGRLPPVDAEALGKT